MYWRLQLASYPIRSVHILPDTPGQVAVSEVRGKVHFYSLETGAHFSDLDVDLDLLDNDVPEERRRGLETLKAPNGSYLPFVEFNASHLFTSEDGELRLIHDLDAGLTLEIEDQSIPLETERGNSVELAALDRELGTVAAFTEDKNLYIFQQQALVNTIPLEDRQILHLFVKVGGSQLLLVENSGLSLIDATGKVIRAQELHYAPGTAALSPDGNWLLLSDSDHQLLRLYNRDLILVRQQHAVDLLSSARQLQLFVDTPSGAAPITSLDIANDGTLAFAISGVICATHIDVMTELPQPRLLL